MRISIFCVHQNKNRALVEKLAGMLLDNDFIFDNENPEVVIVVGGDGTFLKAIKHFKNRLDDIKFVGINTGVLGFLYEYDDDQLTDFIMELKLNTLMIKEIPLVEGIISCNEEEDHILALNEIRIFSNVDCFECDVFIDDEYLEHYIGNGLLVNSMIGSTALCKSLGGAILLDGLDLLELVPMVPLVSNVYSPLNNPLVTKGTAIYRFEGNFENSIIAFDNEVFTKDVDILEIRMSNVKVKMLIRDANSHLNKIKRGFIK